VSDRKSQANQRAFDTLQQILTLATGILALTVTFLKDALGHARTEAVATFLVPLGWFFLLLVVWFAWIAMATATRSLGTKDSPAYVFAKGEKARGLAWAAQWSFAIGVSCFGTFALINFRVFFN
jgi:hypothetical protein